jgi:hypothetical protein
MDVLARMVGTLVADSLKADEEMREMMDINSKDTMGVNNNTKGEWEIHRKSVQSAVRTLLRSLSQDETWMVTQARRKREKEDVFKQNPGMDPVFMKV